MCGRGRSIGLAAARVGGRPHGQDHPHGRPLAELTLSLNPPAVAPPPTDSDTVNALTIAAGALRDAAGRPMAQSPNIVEGEHARSLAATLDSRS